LEQFIHGGLESGQCVAMAEGHDPKFILSLRGAKYCFWDVFLMHPDPVKALSEVEFGEPRSSTKFIEQLIDC